MRAARLRWFCALGALVTLPWVSAGCDDDDTEEAMGSDASAAEPMDEQEADSGQDQQMQRDAGSEQSEPADGGSAQSDPADSATESEDPQPSDALYAVMSLVSEGSTTSAYVSLVPSLEEGVVDDLGESVELAEAAYMFGVDGGQSLYAFNSASELTRYDLSEDGELEEGETLSLLSSGITPGPSERSVYFVAEDKAFLLDDVSLQAISFNPQTMTVLSKIDLGELGKAGWITYFDYRPKARDGQLVVAAYYFDDTFSSSLRESAVALIDTETDEVTFLRDERCGGFSTSVLTEDGDVYFASDPYVDALHRVGGEELSAPGCLLRIQAGEDVFDPDFYAEITDLASGFGGGIIRGYDGDAYLRVYDEEVEAIAEDTSALDLYGRASWRFVRIEPGSDGQGTPADLPPGAGTLRGFDVDGVAYATDASADYSTTTLINMSGGEQPTAGLQVPGNVAGVVRLR